MSNTSHPEVEARVDDALKPCPFCGGTRASYVPHRHAVYCQHCTAEGPLGIYPAGEADAITAWNARVDSRNAQVRVTDEAGLALLRELVAAKNALREFDVFSCNSKEHTDEGCKCFWEQCEAWAKADALADKDASYSPHANAQIREALVKAIEFALTTPGLIKGRDQLEAALALAATGDES